MTEDNCGAEYPHHAHLWTRGDEVSISDAPRCPGVPTTRNVAAEHGIVPREGSLDIDQSSANIMAREAGYKGDLPR